MIASPQPASDLPAKETSLLIEPKGRLASYWREIWQSRELFAIFAWRDISVRYKQTMMGVVWVILKPAVTMIAFTIIFGKVAKLHSVGHAPYAIMVFTGVLPWFLFSTILSDGSNSIVANSRLVSKVYFPRIVIPAASVLVALVDFVLNLSVLAVMMAWVGYVPTWRVLLMPVFVALTAVAAFGPALLMAALNVRYRDFRNMIPFVLQFGLYISPVGFSTLAVPERWRMLFALNPVVAAIDGFRWCILGPASPIDPLNFALGVGVSALVLWASVAYFRKAERSFADII